MYETITEEYLKKELEEMGVEIPLANRMRDPCMALFKQGLIDGSEEGDGFSCKGQSCLPGKFYLVGRRVGSSQATSKNPETREILDLTRRLESLFEE
jgi:hypothetical protein